MWCDLNFMSEAREGMCFRCFLSGIFNIFFVCLVFYFRSEESLIISQGEGPGIVGGRNASPNKNRYLAKHNLNEFLFYLCF